MKKGNIIQIVDDVTVYAIRNNFSGYSKHDALNSPILKALSLNNKWLRLIFIQLVMRFPLNMRPLLFTQKSRNPKGIALFARGYLLMYEVTRNQEYKKLAEELLTWLMENHSNRDGKYRGYCWGYNFIWQSPFFYAPKHFPNLTVSVFSGEAFIQGYRLLNNKKYLDHAIGVAEFVLKDLPVLKETENEKCLGYIPGPVSRMVINVNSMAAAFLSKLYIETKNEKYKENAIKLVNFVVKNVVDNNRWTYTTDIKHSYVDNYHTGGIIDGILETIESLNWWYWKKTLINATDYYKKNFFTESGAPKNRNNTTYPYDIHGSAQGIITFSKMSRINSGYITSAEKYFEWTVNNLYSPGGYFYYQKTRFYIKKFSLMRWCNSWMLYAMGELLSAKRNMELKK